MNSIRAFLLITVSLVVALAMLVSSWAGYQKARYEADELFDAELAQTARILHSTIAVTTDPDQLKGLVPAAIVSTHDWELSPDEDKSDEDERTPLGHSYERKIMFRVLHRNSVIFESDNSPLSPDMHPEAGYQQIEANGFTWYLFTLVDGHFVYTVGERGDARADVARKIALSNLYPSLLALPVLLLALAWALQRGLRPLDVLDAYIQQRDKDNLDPIHLPRTAVEIEPIVDSLNGLLARLRRSLESERRFTATASHEMRTPIAVLKVNVQNALKSKDEAERTALLQDLDTSVDRAGRLINQLLTLNRLEQDDPGFVDQSTDILVLIRWEIAALYPLALAKHQHIELVSEHKSVMMNTVPQIVSLVVRNLVDNAMKYSPEGGHIQVSVSMDDTGILMQVDDSGPGIPEAEKHKIFERFYRMQNATAGGSGLGLAIVRRVVELLGARIEIKSSEKLGGLSMQVFFPPPQ